MARTNDSSCEEFTALIQRNIDTSGFHITTVLAGLTPKYSSTIGLMLGSADSFDIDDFPAAQVCEPGFDLAAT